MGAYDIYGKRGMQIKAGERLMNTYKIGDKTTLKDGIYIALEGAIVIHKGKFIAEFDQLIDKWGGIVSCSDIISPNNPIIKEILKIKKDSDE
jgi:hypothetical protein